MMPKKIAFGKNAANKNLNIPKIFDKSTTTTSEIYDKWIDYMGITDYELYDKATPDRR